MLGDVWSEWQYFKRHMGVNMGNRMGITMGSNMMGIHMGHNTKD